MHIKSITHVSSHLNIDSRRFHPERITEVLLPLLPVLPLPPLLLLPALALTGLPSCLLSLLPSSGPQSIPPAGRWWCRCAFVG